MSPSEPLNAPVEANIQKKGNYNPEDIATTIAYCLAHPNCNKTHVNMNLDGQGPRGILAKLVDIV
jgi:hypothetical protein